MNNNPLLELKEEMERLGRYINVNKNELPTIGVYDESKPYVLVEGAEPITYHYIFQEYGSEREHSTFYDVDSVLFRIFQSIAFERACLASKNLPDDSTDSRRFILPFGQELLGRLNKDWQKRQQLIDDELLSRVPYDDSKVKRARQVREARERGMSYDDALKEAYELFPPQE